MLDFSIAFGAIFCGVVFLLWFLYRAGKTSDKTLKNKRGERLFVLEKCSLEDQKNLFLVRHDDIEHLVFIGPQSAFLLNSQKKSAEKIPGIPPSSGDYPWFLNAIPLSDRKKEPSLETSFFASDPTLEDVSSCDQKKEPSPQVKRDPMPPLFGTSSKKIL